MRYLGRHPIEKLDCQRSHVRRRVSAANRRGLKAKVPRTREILDAALAGRELRDDTDPGPTIDSGDWVPFQIPTEDELLRRIFPPRPPRKPTRQNRIRLKQIERARAQSGWQKPDQRGPNPDQKVEHNDTKQEGLFHANAAS